MSPDAGSLQTLLARCGECYDGQTLLIRGDVPAPNNMRRVAENLLSASRRNR